MSKFLKLVQENTPGEEDGRGPYIVEYKDSQGNVMAKLTILNDVGSSYDNFLDFAKVTQGDLEVASEQPVEDQEIKSGPGTYDIDAEVGKLASKAKSGVAGMAGKMIGTGAQKAKSAMKEREKAAKDAIRVYKQNTQDLKQAIRNK